MNHKGPARSRSTTATAFETVLVEACERHAWRRHAHVTLNMGNPNSIRAYVSKMKLHSAA